MFKNYIQQHIVDFKPTSTVLAKSCPFDLKFSAYIIWTISLAKTELGENGIGRKLNWAKKEFGKFLVSTNNSR